MTTVLVGCSRTTPMPHATSATRSSVHAGWVPKYLDAAHAITAADTIRWTSPNGQAGTIAARAVIFRASDDSRQILLTAVAEKLYPAGYWVGFARSKSYRHAKLGELVAAYRTSGVHALAICKLGNVIVQVNTTRVPLPDLRHFLDSLR